METINTTFVKSILADRPVDMHKGQAGKVLIIAGSRGMAGAAVLAIRGAIYSGAGLVKAAVPDNIIDIIQISVPEAMCIERNTLKDDSFNGYDAIAIGPGMGVNENNYRLLKSILENFCGPVLVDADALSCMAIYGVPGLCKSRMVLTPHPGEADRILESIGEKSVSELGRKKAAEMLSEKTGAVVLLKGEGTVIADSLADKVYINPTGNPGMATGGSGDVLTGIITAIMAGKYIDATPLEAACVGAFVHGLAGDIAAENIGETGMTSADIADAVSMAFREL